MMISIHALCLSYVFWKQLMMLFINYVEYNELSLTMVFWPIYQLGNISTQWKQFSGAINKTVGGWTQLGNQPPNGPVLIIIYMITVHLVSFTCIHSTDKWHFQLPKQTWKWKCWVCFTVLKLYILIFWVSSFDWL